MKKVDLACIIDDDPIYIFATKKVMQMTDFCNDILVYNNGKEALDNLKDIVSSGENVPDIILLDVNMPVMDGWQFLDEFVQIPANKKICIYMVTSSIDPDDINKAKTYDSLKNYIVKPITTQVLQNILSDLAA